jgi:Stress responsive A/B Barrel Domain
MFIHIFGMHWKPEATEADKSRAAEEILAFRGVIPGLVEVSYGPNVSPRGQGYDVIGCMKFLSKTACDAYQVNPIHQALLAWLVPLVTAVELDLEA